MGFLEKLKLKDWLSARNAPTRKAVLYTVDDATGEAVPVAAGQLGGGGGTAPSATYPPQALIVTNAEVGLAVPAGANAATIHVMSGNVRRSIGGAAGAATPMLNAGDSEQISGAELAAYRLIRDGGQDAQVYVEYRAAN